MTLYKITLTLTDESTLTACVDHYEINHKGRFITTYLNRPTHTESKSYPFNMLSHIKVPKIEVLEDFNV